MRCDRCLFCDKLTYNVFHNFVGLLNYSNSECRACGVTFSYTRHLDDNDKNDEWHLSYTLFVVKTRAQTYKVRVSEASASTFINDDNGRNLVFIPKKLDLNPINVKEKMSTYLLFI